MFLVAYMLKYHDMQVTFFKPKNMEDSFNVIIDMSVNTFYTINYQLCLEKLSIKNFDFIGVIKDYREDKKDDNVFEVIEE